MKIDTWLTPFTFGSFPAASSFVVSTITDGPPPDVITASISAAVGSALTLFFTYLLNHQKINSDYAAATRDKLFAEYQRLLEELRNENKELRTHYTTTLAENTAQQVKTTVETAINESKDVPKS